MIAILFDGIVYGLQLSLVAVGLTLIFGLGGVLNLAQGQFAIIAGISTWLLMEKGVSVLVSAGLGISVAGMAGLLSDRLLLLPAYRLRGDNRLLLGLVLTLGFALAIEGGLTYAFPQAELSLRLPVTMIKIAGLTVRTASPAVAAAAILILTSLLLFLKGTKVGKAVRSIIQNEVGAELCGINSARLRTLIFVLGSLIAGFVGISQGLFASLGPAAGFELTTLALIVAVVGGVRSVNGTIVAGVFLGVVHAFSSYLIGAYVTYIIFLATAVFIVLLKPEGLLGRWV